MALFQCAIDGESWKRCGEFIRLRSLDDGTHRIAVRAIALNGAVDRTAANHSYEIYRDAYVIAAAGDIACQLWAPRGERGCHAEDTARLIEAVRPDAVAALGDLQYDSATLSEFESYARTWGRFAAITRPVPGNHEYRSSNASGYFSYFGTRAGDPSRGYYGYQFSGWRLLALNSNCSFVSCAAAEAQSQWLEQELRGSPSSCTLAYWHHPLFSSGGEGPTPAVEPFWKTLSAAGADVVLNGHDHNYERFAPQDHVGNPSSTGVRQFVVGTGGLDVRDFAPTLAPNSEVRISEFGVLVLVLHPWSYSWRFLREDGVVLDQGSSRC